jgi:hypothetical protein
LADEERQRRTTIGSQNTMGRRYGLFLANQSRNSNSGVDLVVVVAIRERFVADSPVEEDGFELSIPLRRGAFLNRLLPLLQLAKPVETEVFDPRGTGGSNPSFSSAESVTNRAAAG